MKKQPLHIVILTDQLYKIGGINRLISTKANYWVRQKGFNVTIITTEQSNKAPFYEFDPNIEIIDLKINYNRNKSYFGKDNFIKVIKNYFRLNSFLKASKANLIIIANHIPVTLFFPLLQTNAKFAKEYHFTQYFKSQKKKSLIRKLETYVESKLDFQIVLNPEEKKYYNSDAVVHIPNPIEKESLAIPAFKLREHTAIAAGRISHVKRFNLLIEIWSEFKKRNKNEWKLEIYGDGPEEIVMELENLIANHKLSNSVKILPPVNNLIELMTKKGMFLMTSVEECFPMVILEAQSAGLPVIAFDCPTGPRNIIQSPDNGILIPQDDSNQYVEILIQVCNDQKLREKLSKNGISSVNKYLLKPIMDEWDKKVFKTLV